MADAGELIAVVVPPLAVGLCWLMRRMPRKAWCRGRHYLHRPPHGRPALVAAGDGDDAAACSSTRLVWPAVILCAAAATSSCSSDGAAGPTVRKLRRWTPSCTPLRWQSVLHSKGAAARWHSASCSSMRLVSPAGLLCDDAVATSSCSDDRVAAPTTPVLLPAPTVRRELVVLLLSLQTAEAPMALPRACCSMDSKPWLRAEVQLAWATVTILIGRPTLVSAGRMGIGQGGADIGGG